MFGFVLISIRAEKGPQLIYVVLCRPDCTFTEESFTIGTKIEKVCFLTSVMTFLYLQGKTDGKL